MNKREFLKTAGILGASSGLVPFGKLFANAKSLPQACVLIPSEVVGPYPTLKLEENAMFLRQDVREDRTGVPLNLRVRVIGIQNCEPMQNVRVNIWHCDKDGNYSGYNDQTGLTYLRGYQMTNANGEADFLTIFPGWYQGRVCHIHFDVRVSSIYTAVSQLTFPEAPKNALYSSNTSIYTKGPDPVAISSDGLFSDGYQYQLTTLTSNGSGGYDAYLEVGVNGSGTSGVGYEEQQNAKQFTLGQNYPNPFVDTVTIPFTLKNQSDVSLELWDVNGKRLTTIDKQNLGIGEHEFAVDLRSLGLASGSYIYQLVVRNNDGVFQASKMMTGK